VKRGVLVVGLGLLLACAVLSFASGFAVASSSDGERLAQTTTTPPPTEPTEPGPGPRPKRLLIAPGVVVGDLAVGWMRPQRAAELLKKRFSRPLPLVVSAQRRLQVAPQKLGANARIEKAIRRARSARPGVQIPLEVKLSRVKLRRYVDDLAKRFNREPVDSAVVLSGLTPRFIEPEMGRHLRPLRNGLAIRIALTTHVRDPIRLDFALLKPKVTDVEFGPSVVILRESKRLLFYRRDRLERRFGIATGQASYPTPIGDFEIVTMQRDPWWNPPPSDWAEDAEPVPPGPGNPLGTRWMGLSAPYVGIHGTPDAASIGYSASHGCIRMRIPEAEWLFQRVEVGTPVFIVAR
jgi:hypothetical protein